MRSARFARRRKIQSLRHVTEKIRIWPGCDGARKSRSTDRFISSCSNLRDSRGYALCGRYSLCMLSVVNGLPDLGLKEDRRGIGP
jgi:hypothetical protein